jgi:hypothetical protein
MVASASVLFSSSRREVQDVALLYGAHDRASTGLVSRDRDHDKTVQAGMTDENAFA